MEADRPRGVVPTLLRLWGIAAWMDLLWVTRDLKQAIIYFLADGVLNVAGLAATLLLAARFNGIGSWTRDQVLFMLGYAMSIGGLLDALFNFNVLHISRRIGRGQLDHVLVEPRPLWMALLTEGFAPFSGSGLLVPGGALLLWSGARLHVALTPLWLAMLAGYAACSCAIAVSFSYLLGCLAFWSPRAAEEISSSAMRVVTGLKGFPLDGAGRVLTAGLLTIIPVGLIAWQPCGVLLGLHTSAPSPALLPVAAITSGIVTALCFRMGLKEYGRTGSQRYLSLGHRR